MRQVKETVFPKQILCILLIIFHIQTITMEYKVSNVRHNHEQLQRKQEWTSTVLRSSSILLESGLFVI